MANSLNKNLTGTFVVLKSPLYKGNEIERVFFCEGGFGVSSFTSGKAVYGHFVFDGEKCRIDGYNIERFAKDNEIKEAEKQKEKKNE